MVVKALIKIANSTKAVVALLLFVWVGAALLFGLIEHHGVHDSLYWSMTTITTTGYGDIAPKTHAGEVLAMWVQPISVFLLAPLVVVNIVTHVVKDRNEFTHEEQEEIKQILKDIRARLDD